MFIWFFALRAQELGLFSNWCYSRGGRGHDNGGYSDQRGGHSDNRGGYSDHRQGSAANQKKIMKEEKII